MRDKEDSNQLCCAVCGSSLYKSENGKSYICNKGHTYDIAKQGYINLLLSNKKGSLHPGDSIEMVNARNHFLNEGYYEEVSKRINSIIKKIINNVNEVTGILDLGCGEGYYLENLTHCLGSCTPQIRFYGMDIAKEAIKLASKRDEKITWIVANNFHLPFHDNSLDIIYSVFSPLDFVECARVLKPKGHLVRVLPNENHLIEMREIIYSRIDKKDKKYEKNITNNMKFINKEDITYSICLDNVGIMNLLKMTPHYWRTAADHKYKLEKCDRINMTVDMGINIYTKIDC